MAERDELWEAVKAEYIGRRDKGQRVGLKELAETFGVNYQTLRNRKNRERWDEMPEKRKRGGQPGNTNSKGKRNAAGPHPGAPARNKNAEKDGAYSAVYFDQLTDQERQIIEETPLEVRAALEHEMKILKFREHKILTRIGEYEKAEEGALYLSATTEIAGNKKTVMRFSDSAFKRIQSLQEALYKVQGRIAKVTEGLRTLEESERRLELERQRLEIMRIRAAGSVEVDDPEGGDLPDVELEDAKT